LTQTKYQIMKLSLATALIASALATSFADHCDTETTFDLINSSDLKFSGYNVVSTSRFVSADGDKATLKNYGATPVVTSSDNGGFLVTPGTPCGADDSTADDSIGASSAMSIIGISSFMMGYPALSTAAFFMDYLPSVVAVEDSHDDHDEDVIKEGCSLPDISVEIYTSDARKPPELENVCAGKKLDIPNLDCFKNDIVMADVQAGTNVTRGYQGANPNNYEGEKTAILTPYFEEGLCPVNVHWHLGTEHYSVGQYDESGSGPTEIHDRRRLAGKERLGFQCTLYDEADSKFTDHFDWKHCLGMEVGQTYEVHWPHSKLGACGTPNQYQTPFYDGVFCHVEKLEATNTDVGVQAQVYTIVNDEAYYYPDLMRGMIMDGEFGSDMAIYTGSTTGTSRNNDLCSGYSPITWQVDRECHLISASSFDKMCADMKAQRDDMSEDLHAHGSRELVDDALAATNHIYLP